MLGSLVVQEHMLKVPLDYAKPEGEQIQLFVRELNPHNVNLPYLIYLQVRTNDYSEHALLHTEQLNVFRGEAESTVERIPLPTRFDDLYMSHA